MIKRVLFVLGFLLISFEAQAQYRALTVSATNGVGLTEQTTLHAGSIYFHYDVNDNWYVSNWTGASYDVNNIYQRWISSEVTANKYLSDKKTFSIGAGLQYRYSMEENLNDFYLVIKISKTFRLGQ